MLIQIISSRPWSPLRYLRIPDEWCIVEALVQEKIVTIRKCDSKLPRNSRLPFELKGEGKHRLDLNTRPLPGYDITICWARSDDISILRKIGGLKIGISFDMATFTQERYKYYAEWSRALDLIFETSREPLFCPTYTVRQGVRKGAPYIEEKSDARDLAFFGTLKFRPDWAKLLKSLNCEIYDTSEPEKGVYDEKLWEAIPRYKIVLGAKAIPFYWSNRIYRMIEVGGFFLTPYKKGLEEEFVNREHVVWFKDEAELPALIEFYLQEEKERKRIRENGWRLAQEKLTNVHRVRQAIRILKKEGFL